MKKLLLSLLMIGAGYKALSQAPVIQWQKNYGGTKSEVAKSVAATADGGYILAGWSSSNDGDLTTNLGRNDIWIVKLTATGTVSWKKSYGGTYNEEAHVIKQTSDGGYIVAGSTGSADGDVTTINNSNSGGLGLELWILKLDNMGNIVWQKCYGGHVNTQAKSVEQLADGSYIVAGSNYFDGEEVIDNHGYADAWVLKLNSSGDLLWNKSYGGGYHDDAYAITATKDGGYIICGQSASEELPGYHDNGAPGMTQDGFVTKIDDTGGVQWQKCLGSKENDELFTILQTPDGGYITAGYAGYADGDVTSSHGNADIWVVKLTSSGAIDWQKCYGGGAGDLAYAMVQHADGSYTIAGRTSSNDGDVTGNYGGRDMWLIKIDKTGKLLWQKCFGGGGWDYAYSLQATTDGGYVLAGESGSADGTMTANAGEQDLWVAKLKFGSVSASLEEMPTTDMQITPNPAENSIAIDIANTLNERVTIIVTDQIGRTVISKTENSLTTTYDMDISSLAAGCYILQVTGTSTTTQKKLFIKK